MNLHILIRIATAAVWFVFGFKAEVLDKGDNPRFVVTNLPAEGFGEEDAQRFAPVPLYEQFYCARGDMENRIKEQQLELFADRTSTHLKGSNQLRLWFSAIAHLIVSRLKAEVLKGTRWARASIGQIRLQLFKIAARVRLSCRRMPPKSGSWILCAACKKAPPNLL